MFNRTLGSAFWAAFGSLCIGFFAATPAFADGQPPMEDRPVTHLVPGTTFTAKHDIFILPGRNASLLEGSQLLPIRACFLQMYYAVGHDRVLRAERTLTLRHVGVGPGYFALAVDDGHENTVAQIGCNVAGPRLPYVYELRDALAATFDIELAEVPVEEVIK